MKLCAKILCRKWAFKQVFVYFFMLCYLYLTPFQIWRLYFLTKSFIFKGREAAIKNKKTLSKSVYLLSTNNLRKVWITFPHNVLLALENSFQAVDLQFLNYIFWNNVIQFLILFVNKLCPYFSNSLFILCALGFILWEI